MPKRQSGELAIRQSGNDVFMEIFDAARSRSGGVSLHLLAPGHPCWLPQTSGYFHFVEHAPCQLRTAESPAVLDLQPGDLVLLPRGKSHRLEGVAGGDGAARVTTGTFHLEGPSGSLVARALPDILRVPSIGLTPSVPVTPKDWLTVTLSAIRLEAEHPTVGSGVMLSRLVDLLLVWIVRHWLTTGGERAGGWINGLMDPAVGRSLAMIHAEPARPWSVSSLAKELHQSRSGFANRFVELVGESPMRYLTRWRMQLAADQLTATNLRVSQVALRVGYDSESAFSRAFRRHLGTAPSDFRKTRRKPR